MSNQHQGTSPAGGPVFGGCSGTSKTTGKHKTPYENRRFRVLDEQKPGVPGGAPPPRGVHQRPKAGSLEFLVKADQPDKKAARAKTKPSTPTSRPQAPRKGRLAVVVGWWYKNKNDVKYRQDRDKTCGKDAPLGCYLGEKL